MTLEAYEDPEHEGNGACWRTGKTCIDCDRPAGTRWSPLWCFECNVARMKRISAQFDEIERRLRAPH